MEQGGLCKDEIIAEQNKQSSHTDMFYMHPLLPSPNYNWENIPVG